VEYGGGVMNFIEKVNKLREITFGGDGCVLSVHLTNIKDRALLERHLYQCKDALKQYPRSKYWKDAIAFIEKKLEINKMAKTNS
jgi:hypothetical protein